MVDVELKPKSFRISDETAERIKAITAEIGGNQQEALSKMIEAYEFQKGKAILVERKADIERFEEYMSILVRMYMGALEDNQNISETIRTEFAALLNSKDKTIQEFQDKCSAISEELSVTIVNLDKLRENHTAANEQLSKVSTDLREKELQYVSMLTDKENLNRALAGTIDELKDKITRMTDEVLAAKETSAKLLEIENSNMMAEHEIASLKKQLFESDKSIDVLKADNERNLQQALQLKEIEFEKKILELEKNYQSAIQKLEQEKRVAIDSYQMKYLTLLEQINKQGFSSEQRKNKVSNKQDS